MISHTIYSDKKELLERLFFAGEVAELMTGSKKPETTFVPTAQRVHNSATQQLTRIPSEFRVSNALEHVSFAQQTIRDWPSLGKSLDFFTPALGAAYLLPSVWQIEPMFHKQLEQRGIPMYQGVSANLPLTVEVFLQTNMEYIVIDAKDSDSFLTAVYEKKTGDFLVCGLQILPYNEVTAFYQKDIENQHTSLATEIHLAPGYPIATQEPQFLNNAKKEFLLSTDYVWEHSDSKTYITACSGEALPVCRFELPFSVTPLSGSKASIQV